MHMLKHFLILTQRKLNQLTLAFILTLCISAQQDADFKMSHKLNYTKFQSNCFLITQVSDTSSFTNLIYNSAICLARKLYILAP